MLRKIWGKRLKVKPTDTETKPVVSNPPQGMCKVVNIYINPQTGKLVADYDDVPVP